MDDNEIWRGEEHLPFLHVYGSYIYHAPVMIRGTRAGLELLKAAVESALASGTGTASVMCTDGEGYAADVVCSDLVAGLGEPEYIYMREYVHFQAEYARASENRMRVLSGPFASGNYPPPPKDPA